MSKFEPPIRDLAVKIDKRSRDVTLNAYLDTLHAVTFGDAVTGAPGQPVDTGNLRGSWPAHSQMMGPYEALVGTNVEYAPAIEEGVGPHGPMRLKSSVGGFHSVAMIRSGWERLVASVAAKVVR